MSEKDNLLEMLKIDDKDRVKAPFAWKLWGARFAGSLVLFAAGLVTYHVFLAAEPERGASFKAGAPVDTMRQNAGQRPQKTQSEPPEAQMTPEGVDPLKDSSGGSSGGSSVRDETVLDGAGYVTARRIATVSAELTGLIREVLIEEGMRVEEGQPLAYLDDEIARADYNQAQARVMAAAARITRIEEERGEALRDLARARSLEEGSYATEARVTAAETLTKSLQAQILEAKANRESSGYEAARLKARLDDHTIRAPFSGVVTVKAAQPGEIVSPISAGGGFTRTGICTIVDMASLEIEVDVNEAYISRVFEGQHVRANLDAYPDWDIKARVIAVIPTANREKATVRVRVAIEEMDSRILPDMGVKVAFLKTDRLS